MGARSLREKIDRATHGTNQFANNGQTDTAPLPRRRCHTLPLDEGVENTLAILLGNTRSLIDAFEAPESIDMRGVQADFPALRTEVDRVRQEIVQNHCHFFSVEHGRFVSPDDILQAIVDAGYDAAC